MKDKLKYCSNCEHVIPPQDKYCRYCGVSSEYAEYRPSPDSIMCIYGPPPIQRVHKCQNCEFTWTTMRMIDNETHCPHCGGPAPAMNADEITL